MKLFLFFIILGTIFITSCGEVIPKPDPSPPDPNLRPRLVERAPPTNPPYSESCSDIPEMAALENEEADPYEIWLACLIKEYPTQGRPTMSYHPLLGEVARARADDLAVNGEDWEYHADGHGYGPNYYVCLVGYDANFCPVGHPGDNFIESLSGGDEPEFVLQGWINSPGHRVHVLGEGGYSEQLYYGIGYAYSTSPPDYEHGGGVYIFIAANPPLDE